MSVNRSEQELVRINALEQLRAMGIEPFPAAEFKASHKAEELLEDFKEGKEVVLAGRLMSVRVMGKASFAELLDSTGRVQIYVNRDELCPGEDKEAYNTVFKKLLDFGDFIGVEGTTFTTQTGEPSILVKKLTVLGKSIRPLPVVKTDDQGNVHDKFSDPELRYRMRYVDLIVNENVKSTFIARSKVMQSMRNFFNERDYLEVETPILQPIPGGASARPFITHHNALDVPLYLRIANELYLKRLIVGGFEGVYEFAKDFRNEGMDRTHNPEFTVMEIYVAYKDYNWMMDFTEEMIERVCLELHGKTSITVGKNEINFQRPFKRVSMIDSIKEFTGHDISGMNEDELREVCKDLKIDIDPSMGKGKLIDEIFGEKCEGNYIQPTFITDYPIEMSPLCKKHRENPELTERFELMVNGKEIANAYSELNDPIDQRARFEEQLALNERGDDEAMFIDQDFLRALEYGMPPCSGMGIGIDRLVMLLTNNESIQEVLFFPQMRPEKFGEKKIELNESEKAIVDLLKAKMSMPLDELKLAANLSNKQWDKGIKALGKLGLTKVEKTDSALLVHYTGE
ncbi:MAG: lysine--tRNA ligase [Flavobacteriales bacterium]|nr:lysine--tRNA ligase [Flavobacteriales bacterium]MDG1765206.1 lysine--tRNA ligase [Flavobacteriales bacterium]